MLRMIPMKKIFLTIIFALLFSVLLLSVPVRAESGIMEEQINMLDVSDINKALRGSSNTSVNKLDVKDLISKAVTGKLDMSAGDIMNSIFSGLFSEISAIISLMRNMILIAVISALFNNLSASFKQKSIGELGFYITYIIIIVILFSSFRVCLDVTLNMISEICLLMESAVPALVSLMVMTGRMTSAYVFNPLLIFIINFITRFVRDALVPVIIAAAGLELINYISGKDLLTKLSGVIKKGVTWAVRATAFLFIGLLAIQSISAPIIDSGILKSAKAVINVVPVVGQALTAAADSVSAWAGAVKAGTMVVMIIIIILMCAGPVLKLLAFIFIFKITAGLIEPISDSRIVKGIDAAGSYAALLLGVNVLVAVMFAFSVMITLSV